MRIAYKILNLHSTPEGIRSLALLIKCLLLGTWYVSHIAFGTQHLLAQTAVYVGPYIALRYCLFL